MILFLSALDLKSMYSGPPLGPLFSFFMLQLLPYAKTNCRIFTRVLPQLCLWSRGGD